LQHLAGLDVFAGHDSGYSQRRTNLYRYDIC
jgi:hypothetical protein